MLLLASSLLLISPAARVTLLPERSRVPASSSAFTPPFLIVTTPEFVAKLSLLNDATPLSEVLASVPENVTVPLDWVTLSPVLAPTPNVNVSLSAISVSLEPSVTVK